MLDNPPQKLELYFAILQLLRMASKWIDEAVVDLESLVEDFNTSTANTAPTAAISNWATLVSYQDKIRKDLVKRIEDETKKVESMKNGVCPDW
jgi:hypothetical protein